MSGPRESRYRLLSPHSAALRRIVAVVLAILVVGSTAAAVPIAAGPSQPSADSVATPVTEVANTTAYLSFPDDSVRTSGFTTVRLDPAGHAAVQTARLHGRYATAELRASFRAAETDAERRRVIVNATRQVNARIDRLEERQAAALAAYSRGELSTQSFLRELVAVHAAADATTATINQLYTFDRAAGMPVSQSAVARLKARLIPLQGPVRALVAERMAAGDGARVHVTTTDSGIALAAVRTGEFTTRYVREAFNGAAFDNQFTDRPLNIETFEQRVSELYPWTWANNRGTNSLLTGEPQYLRAGVYAVAVNHPHGTVGDRDLVIYYDADTESVFYEVQRKSVTATPTPVVAEATSDDLGVRLRSTHPGGPLAVQVYNATTGTPVNATIRLGEEQLGTTGGDRLWTIAPRGVFVVTASTPDGNVTVTATV
ncbi:hypothetical protein [Halosegnis sp.]|uniref:DUF7096 domain-containing protein n=1 Tax=Halosegnis sp. TaxID=2864959 RepID=UPI0035D4DDE9